MIQQNILKKINAPKKARTTYILQRTKPET
jgi:hypothetical protein